MKEPQSKRRAPQVGESTICIPPPPPPEITIRNYFAAVALIAVVARDTQDTIQAKANSYLKPADLAQEAFDMADAMLDASTKGDSTL